MRVAVAVNVQGSLAQAAAAYVNVTIRATKEPRSASRLPAHPAVTTASATSVTRAATANRPSTRRARRRGGDHQSVDLATVRRTEDLTQVATSKQDTAIVGYALLHSGADPEICEKGADLSLPFPLPFLSPSPPSLVVWGSAVSSPSWVQGGAPAENEFGAL